MDEKNKGGAICRTCGGTGGRHHPSIFDPNGVAHADHSINATPVKEFVPNQSPPAADVNPPIIDAADHVFKPVEPLHCQNCGIPYELKDEVPCFKASEGKQLLRVSVNYGDAGEILGMTTVQLTALQASNLGQTIAALILGYSKMGELEEPKNGVNYG